MDVGVSRDVAPLQTTRPFSENQLENVVTNISPISSGSNHELEGGESSPDGQNVAYEYPEGGLAAWIVVAGAFITLTCTYGMMSSIGVLQSHLQTHQLSAYSPSTVGWINSVFAFLNLGLAVQVGPLFDRYGPRWILGIGSFFYVLSIILLGSCKEYYQFMLCLGLLGGVSGASVSTPCLAVLSHWFSQRRGTANGIAMMGSSVGGILFPMVLQPAIGRLGWAWAMRMLGFIFLFVLGVGNICIKSRLPTKSQKGVIGFRCFTNPSFVWITMGMFFAEIVLFSALGLIPTYALAQGLSARTGFHLLAVLNAGSAFGRIVPGILSDRVGRFNTISMMILLTLFVTFVLWYPFGKHVGVLYTLAFLFGFGSGSIISLSPVCVGQICKTEEFGKWFGTSYFAASFGALICIPIGGQLLDVAGPTNLVAFIGGVLGLTLTGFVMSRWACLEYKWKWKVKI